MNTPQMVFKLVSGASCSNIAPIAFLIKPVFHYLLFDLDSSLISSPSVVVTVEEIMAIFFLD